MQTAPDAISPEGAVRPDQPPFLAFVTDADSEAALRDGLGAMLPGGVDVRRGGIRAAIAFLSRSATPRTLVVDVTGEAQPLTALDDLSHVVEPDVRVLVVGDREDANFYRQITRGLGVGEYLYKPLLPDMVARDFGSFIHPLGHAPKQAQIFVAGGRAITVTGVRGGVGASTIAANLAWYLGTQTHRFTALLDMDLHRGTCPMLLGTRPGDGLRTALETPGRIDELFVERATQPVSDRLHVLAAEENLTEQPVYADGAAARLLEALRRRYNLVVADVPFTGHAAHSDMLTLPHQRVLVMTPTLACVRDALRLLALPNGPMQVRRALLVLNRAGMRGGLTRAQVEDALQVEPDLVVPDLPLVVEPAATAGEPAAAKRSAFRTAIQALAREVTFSQRTAGQGRSLLSRLLSFSSRTRA